MKRSQRLVIFLACCLGAFVLVDLSFREPSNPVLAFVAAPLLVLGGLLVWLRGERRSR